jgi:hypothetical protein
MKSSTEVIKFFEKLETIFKIMYVLGTKYDKNIPEIREIILNVLFDFNSHLTLITT